ncbi:hypothetical protein CLIB1444_02S15456 [[Candida] jaroonii]|uniref:Uncharacterized protein n=1 Tax=[Candida] jaroonii TaxID=467808 RepID=A0ACA9Y489_9ASCO|nr:hypothetical protein CLIB1444_02S15456 [[Candida] jaroonii]
MSVSNYQGIRQSHQRENDGTGGSGIIAEKREEEKLRQEQAINSETHIDETHIGETHITETQIHAEPQGKNTQPHGTDTELPDLDLKQLKKKPSVKQKNSNERQRQIHEYKSQLTKETREERYRRRSGEHLESPKKKKRVSFEL